MLRALSQLVHRNLGNITFGQSASMVSAAEFRAKPFNEPIRQYLPGSPDQIALENALKKLNSTTTDVPIIIGNERIITEQVKYQVMPHNHSKRLAKFSYADKPLIERAIASCLDVREAWERRPLSERADILFKAADLVADKYRMEVNAATMLGQGKTIIQAEIDSACELIDFFRFNAMFALDLENYQPISTADSTNRLIYRGLEGFIASISPFNFTAIGGNLASCPALMGNVVVWKPSDTSILSSYLVYNILREAGIPPGVINFIPADGPTFGDVITSSPHLAGINFTGSVPTFQKLWKLVANNLERYISFPRLVGECGGKNFHFIHPSAELDTVAACTIRAAFEYSGQKCSACSRMYVPQSLWPEIREKLLKLRQELPLGQSDESSSFLSAVIDKTSFNRIKSYIDYAKSKPGSLEILAGGKCDDSKGYFIDPTIVETKDPQERLMKEEIFGPVLTVFAYPDSKCEETLAMVKDSTPFGLTGAVFAQDQKFVQHARNVLRDAVGNLYINDKSTGAVVAQQPFGGARNSGTNDKAGGPHYVLKWTSCQTVKETTRPQTEWRYPYMT